MKAQVQILFATLVGVLIALSFVELIIRPAVTGLLKIFG